MMYLSTLLIGVGTDPDRPRPGRLWLRNLYRVHQRLCMAFPSDSRKRSDPQFLAPYRPADFPEQRHLAAQSADAVDRAVLRDVHSQRGLDQGFLFRIDPHSGGRVVILVQSVLKPDWDYAFHNAGYLLAAPWQVKDFDPLLVCRAGATWQFRLRANATVRRDEKRRALLREEDQIAWLHRKANDGGFEVLSVTASRDGPRAARKTDYDAPEPKEHRITLFAVRFDGVLKVTDEKEFLKSLCGGIGPAKAFGFGLLSLARAHPCAT